MVGGDDRIHPYAAIRESFERHDPASLTRTGLMRMLDSLSSTSSASGFNGAAAAGLVRVTAVSGIPPSNTGITTIECDSLGWVLGELGAMPRLWDRAAERARVPA